MNQDPVTLSSTTTYRSGSRGGKALRSHPRGFGGGFIQDLVCELRRILLPRTWVNKGKEEPGAWCLSYSQSWFLKLSLLGRRNRCRTCKLSSRIHVTP